MKNYCTWFPDFWMGVDISNCCKGHDNDCSTRKFYLCLANKVGKFHASYIAFGGSVGCLVKYPRIMFFYYKEKYKKRSER